MVVTALDDVTADCVITALAERGAPVVRVDPADIGRGLEFSATIGAGRSDWAGRLRTSTRDVALERIRAVYYRRPSPWRFDHLDAQARDFAIAEARHGLSGVLANLPAARYINHPASISRAEFKPAQLQAAARLGLAVPSTLITNSVEAAQKFAAQHGPIVYKTFRGVPPTQDGHTGVIWTQRIDPNTLDYSVGMTAHMCQEELGKMADARVTVVGGSVFAHRIATVDGALDWRAGDWDQLVHTPITVPDSVAVALRTYLDHFGLVFGCFDFALTNPRRTEEWIFVECNPNGQWGWLPDAEEIAATFADRLTEGWLT